MKIQSLLTSCFECSSRSSTSDSYCIKMYDEDYDKTMDFDFSDFDKFHEQEAKIMEKYNVDDYLDKGFPNWCPLEDY